MEKIPINLLSNSGQQITIEIKSKYLLNEKTSHSRFWRIFKIENLPN
jgi:hypothetical protein